MNYHFNLGKTVGDISLDMSEEDVINILGKPDKIEKDVPEDAMCFFVLMEYYNLGLSIRFTYYYKADLILNIYINEIESVSISIGLSDKFIFEGKNWFELDKKQIIKTVREIFARYQMKYTTKYEKMEFEDFTSEEYIFDELGIHLFFEDGELSDVFISKPEDELILPEPQKQPKLKTYQLEPLETDLLMVSEPKTEYKKTKK